MPAAPSPGDRPVAELHTAWHPESGLRQPPRCPNDEHGRGAATDAPARCLVHTLRVGDHVWFGAANPDGRREWLQLGPARAALRADEARPTSGVTGHVWVSLESGTPRVMVENLSANVTLTLRSADVPVPVTLPPAAATWPRVVTSRIAALQSTRTELLLENLGWVTTVWVTVRAAVAPPAFDRTGTRDPRLHSARPVPQWTEKDHEDHRELLKAAYRIQLAAREHHHLLEHFCDQDDVRARLRASPSLQQFLTARARTDLDQFVTLQLRRVRDGNPTHEVHRLILEARGEPPRRESKAYTYLVRDHLFPYRDLDVDAAESVPRGGAGGGLVDLLEPVRTLWATPVTELKRYLLEFPGRDRGLEPGIDRR